jgi:hypothetical protein
MQPSSCDAIERLPLMTPFMPLSIHVFVVHFDTTTSISVKGILTSPSALELCSGNFPSHLLPAFSTLPVRNLVKLFGVPYKGAGGIIDVLPRIRHRSLHFSREKLFWPVVIFC